MMTIKTLIRRLVPRQMICQRLNRQGADSVLLTFDDGPDPEITPVVLDLLAEHQAKGIFFVPGGRIPNGPELLNRLLAEGHLLGNHTFAHPGDEDGATHNHLADLSLCQQAIFEQTGHHPRLFRPAYGQINPAILWAAYRLNLQVVRWSYDAGEYNIHHGASAQVIADALLTQVQGGDIVLLHDVNPLLPEILEQVLPGLRERGLDLSRGIGCL